MKTFDNYLFSMVVKQVIKSTYAFFLKKKTDLAATIENNVKHVLHHFQNDVKIQSPNLFGS